MQAGINIVLKALETPLRQIAENSGMEGSIVVNKILENKSESFGFDAQNETYVDMIEKGIVDPAKVVRAALQDARLWWRRNPRTNRPCRLCRPAAEWAEWTSKSVAFIQRKGRGKPRPFCLSCRL